MGDAGAGPVLIGAKDGGSVVSEQVGRNAKGREGPARLATARLGPQRPLIKRVTLRIFPFTCPQI